MLDRRVRGRFTSSFGFLFFPVRPATGEDPPKEPDKHDRQVEQERRSDDAVHDSPRLPENQEKAEDAAHSPEKEDETRELQKIPNAFH